ncbi:MAG TPA: NAD(P)/FAD-dependent oxidoreductase [Anaerolineae bacterium]|nr:MAG: tricarballylate dehydrogenase [Chloroflexi bacterium ADurb.Bin222]HOC21058.1 NAD(P)/FAD-dependent oxidoreductase [Anaerolineae bacterium]HQM14090.1 NAD(P)/FAD-dependent oxidoreductase [Anaerolineae bacterium]
MTPRRNVIVIGAGAAGLMAAGRAAELGARVLLLEKMGEAGKKILVTGQERCNVTNAAPLEAFLTAFGHNGPFLRNAFHRFFREELLALLRRYGVETQVERGGRIFPASGRAADVRDALLRYATEHGATIRYHTAVQELLVKEEHVTGVRTVGGETFPAAAAILATGGASWPGTGSTGDGYVMARDLGHTLVPLRPALVPLTVAEKARAKALQGVSLRNVACTLLEATPGGKDKVLPPPWPLPPTGEVLFTHFGLSGPLVLSLSLAAVDAVRAGKSVTLALDLKPGMTFEEVRARLQREFEQYPQRKLPHLLRGWLPGSLADELAKLTPSGAERPVFTIRAGERDELATLLKNFRWRITGSLPLAAGMVTAGGVALKEVDPRSFASRRVAGLHLVGEVLDLAADTGGYNLQAAFSSGYLAGEAAAGD